MAASRSRQGRDNIQAEVPQRSAPPLRDSPDRQQRGERHYKPRRQPSRPQACSYSPVSPIIADSTVDGTPGSREGQSPANSNRRAELQHSMQSRSLQELEVTAVSASRFDDLHANGESGASTDAAEQQYLHQSQELPQQQPPVLDESISSERRQPLRDASPSRENAKKAAILQECDSEQPFPFEFSPHSKQQRFTRPPKVRRIEYRILCISNSSPLRTTDYRPFHSNTLHMSVAHYMHLTTSYTNRRAMSMDR